MATAMVNFHNNLLNWASKNGFSNIDFDYHNDFCCDNKNYIIYIGINNNNQEGLKSYNEQFFYEYGCEYTNIWMPIIAFLHELGHIITYNEFTQDEIKTFHSAKIFIEGNNFYDCVTKYWLIPDEFSANIWAINFINNNIKAVEELYTIMVDGYTAIYADGKIWDYIDEKENS